MGKIDRFAVAIWFAAAFGLALAPIAAADARRPAVHHAAAAMEARAGTCTKAQAAAADAVLTALARDPAKTAATAAAQMPWGAPAAGPNEVRLVQPDYVIDYDKVLRVPIWTAERVEAARLDAGVGRQDCFRGDPRLDADASSLPSDYSEPLYDQGHMTPFADQRYNRTSGYNSFVMTNMAPQICELNRGIWQILEQISRRWAARHDDLYVLNGSVFDRDGDGVRDPDAAAQHMQSNNHKARVAVPSAFYKVAAYKAPDGTVETVAVLLPHDTSNPTGPAAVAYLNAHVTDLATIRRLTGLSLLPDARAVRESRTLWPFDGYKPQSLCHAKAKPAGQKH